MIRQCCWFRPKAGRSPAAARSRTSRSMSAKLDPLTPAAFIAIEDRRFRSHWGIDPRAIGRAMVANFQAGGVRQGGSTLTQQLAKTSFLSADRSLKRKAQEVIIAFWLEGWLTKDEILSRYLSIGLLRRWRLRPAGRLAPLFRPGAGAADPGAVGDAGRNGESAVAAGADPEPRAGPEAQPAGAAGDGRHRRDQSGSRGSNQVRPAGRRQQQCSDRHLFRRLGRAAGGTGIRCRLWRGEGSDHSRCRSPAAGGSRNRQRPDRRCAGSAGGDAARWSGRRDGRRAQLWQKPVQPRDPGPSPARQRIQAVRLSGRTAGRLHARQHDRGSADHRRWLVAGQQ